MRYIIHIEQVCTTLQHQLLVAHVCCGRHIGGGIQKKMCDRGVDASSCDPAKGSLHITTVIIRATLPRTVRFISDAADGAVGNRQNRQTVTVSIVRL